MRLKGSELIFISQINRDGSGTSEVVGSYESILQKEYFNIHNLSISEKTYIAIGFNSFVVKLSESAKNKINPFCTCENEYGHMWNKKGDRLICTKCKKKL